MVSCRPGPLTDLIRTYLKTDKLHQQTSRREDERRSGKSTGPAGAAEQQPAASEITRLAWLRDCAEPALW